VIFPCECLLRQQNLPLVGELRCSAVIFSVSLS
jgi:hypothetical protein